MLGAREQRGLGRGGHGREMVLGKNIGSLRHQAQEAHRGNADRTSLVL